MTLHAALIVPAADPVADPGLRGAIRDMLRRLTWRDLLVTLLIALALDAWLVLEMVTSSGSKLPSEPAILSGTIINLLLAYCVMFTTLVADQMVARGAGRLPCYAWAVVTGCVVAALAQWPMHNALHMPTRIGVLTAPYEKFVIQQPAVVFFESLIWAAIIVFIYVNRRTAALAAARMSAAQMELAQTRRTALESRLQALQARIEPQFLFDTLARVCALYEINPARGGQTLGDLIDYLRAALPNMRTSGSTLDQELALVRAYVAIMGTRAGEPVALDIAVPQPICATPMPAMVLLPLINHVLAESIVSPDGSGTLRVAARVGAGMLRIEIANDAGRADGHELARPLREIREQLHDIYGDRARVTVESAGAVGIRAVLEIPHETSHSNHR